VKGVLAFWIEFDRQTSFPDGIFLSAHVGIEQSELGVSLRIVGVLSHSLFESWCRRGNVTLGGFEVSTATNTVYVANGLDTTLAVIDRTLAAFGDLRDAFVEGVSQISASDSSPC
jgi:hypothetical protein